tara:strand:+ start:700 stop:1443 length:744 start_codon:yes stop_codon:yes gene_type:complete
MKEDKKKDSNKIKVRLNKYISNSGLCSRREADRYILKGLVSVNNKIVKDLGTKVFFDDKVELRNKIIEKSFFNYFLLNKPKGSIVTNQGGTKNNFLKIFSSKDHYSNITPFGDMGKSITGLLVMTNDIELIKRLNRPKCKINMIYQLTLDKKINNKHIEELKKGVTLEEKIFFLQELDIVKNTADDVVIGIRTFSIMPSIINKMFKKLNYKVLKMDRVVFAGLTKKDLPRGRWRKLTSKEVGFLKML